MGIIDTISFIAKIKQKADSLKDYLGGKKEEPKSKGGNMLFDILSMGRTQMKRRAEKIKEQAEKDRESIFGEVFESVLARYFPTISKLMDLSSTVGITKRDKESWPLQNEIETLTMLSMFIPDIFLKKITDPLVKSKTFHSLVKNWPVLHKDWLKKIKSKDYDPDDVIDILRIMHQDMISGKVTISKVIDKVM